MATLKLGLGATICLVEFEVRLEAMQRSTATKALKSHSVIVSHAHIQGERRARECFARTLKVD